MKLDFENIVTQRKFTFKHLIEEILKIFAKDFGRILSFFLNRLDDALYLQAKCSRSLKGWESIGKRERSLVTIFGLELRYKRRGYRRKEGSEWKYWYPLDEFLGLKPDERFCPLVQQIAVVLASKVSFREAASFLQEYLLVPVSHEKIHEWLQEAGEKRNQEQEEARRALFEDGEVPEGRKEAELVVIEADSVVISLQRSQQKKAEIKLGTMHEGWEPITPAQTRFRLKEKKCWGGIVEEAVYWEHGTFLYCSHYRKADHILINGDGAEWVKAAQEYFPEAKIYLNRFHRNRALNEALSFSPELLQRAYKCLNEKDLPGFNLVLAEAILVAPSGKQKERIKKLKKYFAQNPNILDWRLAEEGELPNIPILRGLGASEPQNNHVIAARMKKRGMSWTVEGANNMVQMRCLAASEELKNWLDNYQEAKWPEVSSGCSLIQKELLEPLQKATDPAAWLQAKIPLLATKAQGTPLGEALKALSRIPSLVA